MMGKYKYVSRCKTCNKIYPNGIPKVCYKCGTKLGYETIFTDHGKLFFTDNCEKVVARRKLFKGWEVKDDD